MNKYPIPTRSEQDEFLIRMFFGFDRDYLHSCIEIAYLDLCRTLRGISKHPDNPNLKKRAVECLQGAFKTLPSSLITDQAAFDNWHQALCSGLCKIYQQGDFPCLVYRPSFFDQRSGSQSP